MKLYDSWVTNKLCTLVAVITAFDVWHGQKTNINLHVIVCYLLSRASR